MFAGRHHLTALALCWLSRPLHINAADMDSACSWQIAHGSVMSGKRNVVQPAAAQRMLHELCLCSEALPQPCRFVQCVCACRVYTCMQGVFVRAENCAIQAG